ncbi:MAG: hypothetical protein ACOC9N_01410 [Gemmatimonadota bacterium]
MNHHLRLIALLAAAASTGACADAFEPFLTPIPPAQEIELVDFEGGALVDPAAVDMFTGNPVRTDQTNGWDFLFVDDEDEGPALLPRAGLLGGESEAGLQPSDEAFDALAAAPESDYTMDALVPVEAGDVIIMVSRRNPQLSVRCRVYGKLEVLSIEGSPAVARIDVVINPNCERRELIDQEED